MTIKKFRSAIGYAVGDETIIDVIDVNANITSNGLSSTGNVSFTGSNVSLGNVANLHITGGSNGQALVTDGAGVLSFQAINATSNRAAPMPYNIPIGESYIVDENFQGLFAYPITIDGELEVDGVLIEVGITIDSDPGQIFFDDNGNPTGNAGFTFDSASGNFAVPGNGTFSGNLLPNANITYNLGSPTQRWLDLYLANNTIYLGNSTISAIAGNITLSSAGGATLEVTGNANVTTIVNGNSNISVNANGNVTTSVAGVANVLVVSNVGTTITGNVAATGIKSDNLYYANGTAWNFGGDPGGANTQLQFNSDETFGGSANLTFNTSTNVMTLGGNLSVGNVSGANLISANYLVSNSGCVSVNGAVIAFNSGTGAAGIFSSLATDINFGLAANVTIGSTTGTSNVRGQLSVGGNATITGNVSANLITGTLATSAQPNITSVGTLASVNVTGNATSNIAIANTTQTNSLTSKRSSVAVTTATVIDSFSAAAYRTAKYIISSQNDEGFESLEVLLIHNNINSYVTIYGAINDSGSNTVSITTSINSGNVELQATGLAANTEVRLIGTYVPVI
jgi:hypothetical protein